MRDNLPKLSYADYGLRSLKATIVSAGKVMRSGQEESFAMALAIRNGWLRMLPKEYQYQMLSLVALTFLGASQMKLTELQNYTTCKYMNIVKSPYLALMDGFETRHGMHIISKPQVLEVVQDLSNFLKNIGVYETRVYSFECCPFNASAQ